MKTKKVTIKHIEKTEALPGHYELYLPSIPESVVTIWEVEGVDAVKIADAMAAALETLKTE